MCACQLHKSHRNDIRGGFQLFAGQVRPAVVRTYSSFGRVRERARDCKLARQLLGKLHISRFTACPGRNINSILNKYTAPYINSCLVFALFCISSARAPILPRLTFAPVACVSAFDRADDLFRYVDSVYLAVIERRNSLSDVKSRVSS